MGRARSGCLGAATMLAMAACSATPSEVDDPTESPSESSDDDSIPATCHNGVLNPSEDCDDGNDDPLDGCLSNCRFGPRALISGAPYATAQYGDLGSGTPFDDDCPPGQALVGLRGQTSPEGWLTRIQGYCGVLQLVARQDGGFAVQVLEGEALAVHGTTEGEDAVVRCPTDQVVVSFSGRAGTLVDRLELSCAPIYVLDQTTTFEATLGEATMIDPLGGDGGGPFPDTPCGSGALATGIAVRSGGYVDALGLRCAALVLQIGPA